jgi:hypothetical protein
MVGGKGVYLLGRVAGIAGDQVAGGPVAGEPVAGEPGAGGVLGAGASEFFRKIDRLFAG